MHNLVTDLRFALRNLWSRPGFTLAAVVALALGLGANTAIFSVFDGVVWKPLPYPQPDRLVMLWETNAAQALDHERLSPVNFLDYRGLSQVFEDAAAWWQPEVNLTDDEGEPVRVTTVETSGNLFAVLRVEPQLGPGFAWKKGDDLHGTEPQAVISDGLWRRRYGADPAVLGKSLQLNGRPFTVVGVMPPGCRFPGETDVWQRLVWNFANHSRHAHFTEAVARLAPGATLEQAQAELTSMSGRLATEFVASNKDWLARAVPLDREVQGDFRPALMVLLAAVGLLLLLSCANVANLLLARASGREREVAVRTAMGAGRGRLAAQFFTESLLLAGLGAAAGLALALVGVRALVTSSAIDIPRLSEISLDGRVLAFCLAATVVTACLFGLAPAVQLAGRDLHGTLKEGGRGVGSGVGARRLRGALVVVEVAVAAVLLVGAGLLLRSLLHLLKEDPGFRPERAVTMNLELPAATYQDWRQVSRFYDELLQRLASHPAIRSAGASGFLPLSAGWRFPYLLPGEAPPEPGEQPEAQMVTVTPGYFETLGIPLLAGRSFSRWDTTDSPGAVVVNEALARRAWPEEEAVGKTLTSPGRGIGPLGRSLRQSTEYEVIGVMGDVKNTFLASAVEPAFFLVHTQFPYRNMNLVVRGEGSAAQLAAVVREEVRRLDAGLPLADVRELSQLLADSTATSRFLLSMMAGFAALAVALAAVGIYGVLSYAVAQRRGEIGVRLALGAPLARVRRMVVSEGMSLVALGLGIGLALALLLGRSLSSLLFGVAPTDATAFAGALAVILGVALAACYLPARRASAVAPVEALRVE